MKIKQKQLLIGLSACFSVVVIVLIIFYVLLLGMRSVSETEAIQFTEDGGNISSPHFGIEGISKSESVDEIEVNGEDEKGIYRIKVQITAFQDIWIPDSVSSVREEIRSGFKFAIEGDLFEGPMGNPGISSFSSRNTDGERIKVAAGTSENFTIMVQLDPLQSGVYGIELTQLNYSMTYDGVLIGYKIPDEPEFETDKVAID